VLRLGLSLEVFGSDGRMVHDVPVLRSGQITVREDLEAARYREVELELLRDLLLWLSAQVLMEKKGRSHGIHKARKQWNGRISNMSGLHGVR
jgi:hypothetical protein